MWKSQVNAKVKLNCAQMCSYKTLTNCFFSPFGGSKVKLSKSKKSLFVPNIIGDTALCTNMLLQNSYTPCKSDIITKTVALTNSTEPCKSNNRLFLLKKRIFVRSYTLLQRTPLVRVKLRKKANVNNLLLLLQESLLQTYPPTGGQLFVRVTPKGG